MSAAEPAKRPPLQGIRVVEFSHYIAGPFCALMLADLGAEVIKIEKPAGGDDLRRFAPSIGDTGGAFLWANRNKRSIVLDLRNAAARDIALELVDGADVLIENFAAGVMARFGFDQPSLQARNPRLVYCSIPAFAREGPNAGRVALDPIVQAEAGFMSVNGDADREGVRTGPSIMDLSAAMMACNGILAALLARERGGAGQHVEVPLFEQAITMLGMHAVNCLVSGQEPRRSGNMSPDAAPSGVFEASDGRFYMSCPANPQFAALAALIDRRDWIEQHEFATREARQMHAQTLHALLAAVFVNDTRQRWVERLQTAGIPAGIVRTVGEALHCEESRAAALVGELMHPRLGRVPTLRLPLHLSATPLAQPRAAPDLGADTEAVLDQCLGKSAPQIAELRQAGAFGRA